MMTKAQKRKWIEALRSGKYRQGTSSLYKAPVKEYCCLGVYCHAVLGVEDAYMNYKGLPADLYRHGVLTRQQLRFIPQRTQDHLAMMNDDKVPFEVIAGFIQENVPSSD